MDRDQLLHVQHSSHRRHLRVALGRTGPSLAVQVLERREGQATAQRNRIPEIDLRTEGTTAGRNERERAHTAGSEQGVGNKNTGPHPRIGPEKRETGGAEPKALRHEQPTRQTELVAEQGAARRSTETHVGQGHPFCRIQADLSLRQACVPLHCRSKVAGGICLQKMPKQGMGRG